MKNLLDRIISIDQSETSRLEKAMEEQEKAKKEIAQRTQALAEEIESYAQNHLLDFEKVEKESTDAAMEKITASKEQEKERLTQIFDEKKDDWTEQIFRAVLEDKTFSPGQVS